MIAAIVLLALAEEPQRANDLPLRNDATLGLAKEQVELFARGDALEPGSAQAFDAWHAALAAGALDASSLTALPAEQGGSARGGESAELALLRRLAALGPQGFAAWRARFEALAEGELAFVSPEESSLDRFVAAHAGTRAAELAALRQSDLARERGDDEAARAALARVRRQGPLEPALEAALARRALAPEAARALAGTQLEALFTLELREDETREDWILGRRAGAGLAELDDGRIVWACAGGLRQVDASGTATSIELGTLSNAPEWSFLPAFRDEPSPWPGTLLASGTRVRLALGRARGGEGNLYAALELPAAGAASLAWAWTARGMRLGDDESARVLPAGLWEYQPGAVESAGRTFVCARRYSGGPEQKPEVDELHAETWCLCLENASGSLVFARQLGSGSDPATRDPARRPEPRGFCAPADPLSISEGRVLCSTGLGWLSVLDPGSGRVLGSYRAGLEAELTGVRALATPPLGAGGGIAWQPAASAFEYRIEPGAGLRFEPAGTARNLGISAGGRWSVRPDESGARVELRRVDDSAACASVALPRGERVQAAAASERALVLATGRALYVFDVTDPARLLQRVPLALGAQVCAPGSGALIVRGQRLACAVGRGLALFRVR